ncbi:helix-turn-helix transcriptional regulator [Methyloceanibacter sp.]|uniref:helix-turn-helix transcriptional regulator n=1 Tax=Methyloceanibacter sp. TaxID=1965321 RepID=UPI003D6D52CA
MNDVKVRRFIRLDEVKHLTGISRSSIYAREDFPRPVKIGKHATAWLEHEVQAWIERRVATREVA